MIKLLITIVFGLSFFSCNSNTVKENFPIEAKPSKDKPVVTVSSKVDDNLIPTTPPATTAVAPAATAVKPKELDLAIASGDDEKIKLTSLDLLQANSKNQRALNALAIYYYKRRNFEAAKLLLNKALAINPKSSTAYNNFGLIELARNDKNEAVNMFRKALQNDPENYIAAGNVAAIYAKEKDFNKVILSLEKSINNEKTSTNSLNNYAIALAATDKPKEAAAIYERILKENPDDKNVMLNYSILLIEKQAKFKEGLDLVNRLKFVGADNESRQVIKDLEIRAKAGLK